MKPLQPSLMPILRSDAQGKMLAWLLDDPEAEHTLSALAERAETSFATAQREVQRLEAAGLVTTRRVGQARLVKADAENPYFQHVRALVVPTYGVPAVIQRWYADLPGAHAVLIFGSWAARFVGVRGRAPNDIDVLVIGEPDPYAADDAASASEAELGFPVQTTVRNVDAWTSGGEAFVREVKARPFVAVLVDDTPGLADGLRQGAERAKP